MIVKNGNFPALNLTISVLVAVTFLNGAKTQDSCSIIGQRASTFAVAYARRWQAIGQTLELNEDECLLSCQADATCASITYDFDKLSCVKYSSGPNLPTDLTVSDTESFYEKICVNLVSDQTCPLMFERYPSFIFVGFAEQVLSVVSRQDCLNRCVEMPTCNSVVYFAQDQSDQCVLNVETKDTHPDLFAELQDEERSQSDYYHRLSCDADWLEWSGWTDCSRTQAGSATQQSRTRQCDTFGRCVGLSVEDTACPLMPSPAPSTQAPVQRTTSQPATGHNNYLTTAWSVWSSWTVCTFALSSSQQKSKRRERRCILPGRCGTNNHQTQDKVCDTGEPFQKQAANLNTENKAVRRINNFRSTYGWSTWESWGRCDGTERTRERLCSFTEGCQGPFRQTGPCPSGPVLADEPMPMPNPCAHILNKGWDAIRLCVLQHSAQQT